MFVLTQIGNSILNDLISDLLSDETLINVLPEAVFIWKNALHFSAVVSSGEILSHSWRTEEYCKVRQG